MVMARAGEPLTVTMAVAGGLILVGVALNQVQDEPGL